MINRLIPIGENNPNKRIKPDTIVIHYTATPNVDGERTCLCLQNNNANGVSANYVVDWNNIYQCIRYGLMSYGVTGHNNHVINIEVCHHAAMSDSQFDLRTICNLRELVTKLMKRTGIPATKVVRHYDLTGKKCPWYYVENPEEWVKLRRFITGGELC